MRGEMNAHERTNERTTQARFQRANVLMKLERLEEALQELEKVTAPSVSMSLPACVVVPSHGGRTPPLSDAMPSPGPGTTTPLRLLSLLLHHLLPCAPCVLTPLRRLLSLSVGTQVRDYAPKEASVHYLMGKVRVPRSCRQGIKKADGSLPDTNPYPHTYTHTLPGGLDLQAAGAAAAGNAALGDGAGLGPEGLQPRQGKDWSIRPVPGAGAVPLSLSPFCIVAWPIMTNRSRTKQTTHHRRPLSGWTRPRRGRGRKGSEGEKAREKWWREQESGRKRRQSVSVMCNGKCKETKRRGGKK